MYKAVCLVRNEVCLAVKFWLSTGNFAVQKVVLAEAKKRNKNYNAMGKEMRHTSACKWTAGIVGLQALLDLQLILTYEFRIVVYDSGRDVTTKTLLVHTFTEFQ